MHHIRGLIREASTPLLRALEKQALQQKSTVPYFKECFKAIQLIDAHGCLSSTNLVLTPQLLSLIESLPTAEALTVLTEAQNMCTGSIHIEPQDHKVVDEVFYVKDTCSRASREIQRRQILLISRLLGKAIALQSTNDDDCFAAQMNHFAQISKTNDITLKDVGVFRGLIQELSVEKPKLALALAVDERITIPLSGSESHFAKMVDISTPSAVQVFLQTFNSKDMKLPAAQSCATALAMRIRKEARSPSTETDTDSAVMRRSESDEEDYLLSICRQYHVDPGSVYPTDAGSIQKWASAFFPLTALPVERREAVIAVVKRRQLAPRRICLNALSVWCGSDVESEWIEHSLSSDECSDGGSSSSLLETSMEAFPFQIARRAALQLLLKDPQRNLLENHLLSLYSELLSRGDISVTDPSFSSFMDECGECHTCDQDIENGVKRRSTERPSRICFTTPVSLSSSGSTQSGKVVPSSVYSILFNLAPKSSYWTALLEHTPSAFKVWTAPCNEIRVEVTLPRHHECVLVEQRKSSGVSAVGHPLSIIYEDDDILVLNKPAGLATTRHGLSCSESKDENMTDLVSVLISSRPELFRSLPRNGMVHRLDTDTSGCILFAKTSEAVSSCRHQFGTSASFSVFSKVYLALCAVTERGWDSLPLSGTLKDPMDSKIITKYRILRFYRRSRVALVECRIQQGKKHQVRRHLATAGLPLLGDLAHGGAACAQGSIQRVLLHASSMTVLHPRTAEGISFSAPLPEDFRRAFAVLR